MAFGIPTFVFIQCWKQCRNLLQIRGGTGYHTLWAWRNYEEILDRVSVWHHKLDKVESRGAKLVDGRY
eukprot:3041509-Amphidinium_carterae.1